MVNSMFAPVWGTPWCFCRMVDTTQSTSCDLEKPLIIQLGVLNVEVGTAEVIAPRTLNEIIRDIQALQATEKKISESQELMPFSTHHLSL